MIKQLTVFLSNSKGRLTALASALGEAGINMSALTIADTTDYGIVRIVCDRPEVAVVALTEAGFTASIAEVVGVEVPHEPGGLAKVLSALDGADINIEYSYCFANARNGATVALKADTRAVEVLAQAGFTIVEQADL